VLDSRKHSVVAVVSQPARKAGRGQSTIDPPLAGFAKQMGIATLQPESPRDPSFLSQLKDLEPDLAITASYGQILSDTFLAIPKRGTINIHPSLLPKYRGAIPVQAALMAGDTTTGVSILFTVKALDAGAIILQKPFVIDPNETAELLLTRLFQKSSPLLIKSLSLLEDPSFAGTPQDESLVTHCSKLEKSQGQIQWNHPAVQIFNLYRAFYPWPGVYSFFQGKRYQFTNMSLSSDKESDLNPGSFRFDKPSKTLKIQTGQGTLEVLRIKPEGSKEIDALAFWNGLKHREGLFFAST
jgi:methionyl-tRNA formyltransferase